MKQKIMIIFAVVFVLFFTVGELAAQNQWWYITGQDGGRSTSSNTLTLQRGEAYIYIYFTDGMPGGDFEKLQLEFTTDNPVDVYWQAAYLPNQLWGPYPGGRNKPAGAFDFSGFQGGMIETDLSHLIHTWHDGTKKPFTKSEITGICLQVRATARTALTLNNVNFSGLRQ